MDIVEIINQIEADKISKRIIPSHALYTEIVGIVKDRKLVNTMLRNLKDQCKIETGQTINDVFVKLIK